MRMSSDAFCDLVDRLRPRHPRRGVPPEVRTAIVLRYLGGGSYLNICTTLGVHTCTIYRALWDIVDAVHSRSFSDRDFQFSSSPRRLAYASGFQSRRNSPFGHVCGALRETAVEQEQPLATEVPCVAGYCSRKGFYVPGCKTEQRAAGGVCSESVVGWVNCTRLGRWAVTGALRVGPSVSLVGWCKIGRSNSTSSLECDGPGINLFLKCRRSRHALAAFVPAGAGKHP